MQIRLIACIAGGLIGLALTSTVNSALEMTPVFAWIGCGLAGVALGYAASLLLDVFVPTSKH